MIDAVVEMALALGNGGENREVLLALSQVAVEELEGRLRGGVTPEDCQPAFVIGAAWIALDRLGCATEVSSFSVGDFSVTAQSGGYRRHAEDLMKPYLQLSDFAFCSVKG